MCVSLSLYIYYYYYYYFIIITLPYITICYYINDKSPYYINFVILYTIILYYTCYNVLPMTYFDLIIIFIIITRHWRKPSSQTDLCSQTVDNCIEEAIIATPIPLPIPITVAVTVTVITYIYMCVYIYIYIHLLILSYHCHCYDYCPITVLSLSLLSHIYIYIYILSYYCPITVTVIITIIMRHWRGTDRYLPYT